jgi:hypothetical protein
LYDVNTVVVLRSKEALPFAQNRERSIEVIIDLGVDRFIVGGESENINLTEKRTIFTIDGSTVET